MKHIFFLLIIAFLMGACSSSKSPVDYVNPMIGTGFHGHTYPGATVPFGAVQLSPDTRRGNWDACSGYHYSDSTIMGFSHTHLSGTGCIDLGDILVHPSIEDVKAGNGGLLYEPLAFSHRDEHACAGYYSVKLGNGVLAELTATPHVGVHRYTFPANSSSSLVVDLAHLLDNETIHEARLQIAPGEISGMRRTSGWVPNQSVYFVARFSEDFNAELISNGEVIATGNKVDGTRLQAILRFEKSSGNPIVCKVGISQVSIDNARLNLDAEIRDFDFDRVKKEASDAWNKKLGAFRVSGGTPNEMTNFYTGLYHCMVTPNLVSDVTGEYRGADDKIYKSSHKHYSTMSLWDTFRGWNPLMTLADTTLVGDMVNSFLDFYDQTGELPVWPLASGETGTMIGYHSVSVIYDAFSKNIRGFNAGKALDAMKVSAAKNRKATEPYLPLGFIPADSKRESVSCLLENAYDDWCIARMAKALGRDADYQEFRKRSDLYKNVFDGQSRFFRSRMKDGIWEAPFNPEEVGRAYTEATAWQYRFFVPHDVNGLVNLFGGQTHFVMALDSLFHTTAQTKGHLSDITGMVGQYAHGNEPSHHMAYLYTYAGQAWKTQAMVRRLLGEMYQPTPEGISGNEDCGQMSAWYVLSSLGLYSVCPGSTQFVFGSPLFPRAEILLPNGKSLTVTANDPQKNVYVQQVIWNGTAVNANYISYQQLMEGGTLNFVLGSQPNEKRAVGEGAYPYSQSDGLEVSVPFVSNDISFFESEVMVSCGSATDGAEIRYTLDGTEPGPASLLYTAPFRLDHSVTVKLKGFKQGYAPSVVATYQASKADYKQAVAVSPVRNGIYYRYFEGKFSRVAELTTNGKLICSGITDKIDLSVAKIPDHYGLIFSGYIYAPVDGVYTFSTRSDDGSVLKIHGQTVVDNDTSHAEIRAVGRMALKKGYHPYELWYFEDYEGEALSMGWIVPGKNTEELVPVANLFVK